MRADINKRLKICKQVLDGLGPNRDTKDQQYKYLLDLATRFQEITSHALRAYYGADSVFDDSPDLKLATAVVHRNATFSDDVWRKGHTMGFSEDVGLHEDACEELGEDYSEVEDGHESCFDVRYNENDRELDDLMQADGLIWPPKATGIEEWLAEVYESSQGFELGTFDPALLPIVWKKQSEKWNTLALAYINDVVSIVHDFTVKLLSKICKDERIRRGLNSVLLEDLIERYKKGIEHTKYLLAVERSGTPLTTNHYFAENLEKW